MFWNDLLKNGWGCFGQWKLEPIYQGMRIWHLRTSIPFATKGDILIDFLGCQQLWYSPSLVIFSCPTKSRYSLNFSIFEVSMTISNNTNGGPKTNRTMLTLWKNTMLLESLSFHIQHLEWLSTSFSRRKTPTVLQLTTSLNMPDFTKLSSQALWNKWRWVYYKRLYYIFRF